MMIKMSKCTKGGIKDVVLNQENNAYEKKKLFKRVLVMKSIGTRKEVQDSIVSAQQNLMKLQTSARGLS